jgi:hypothetical protein
MGIKQLEAFMKKSTLFLAGMAALLLSFGLILTGCPTDSDDSSGGGGYTGEGEAPTQFQFTGTAGDNNKIQVSIRTNGFFPSWTSSNPTGEGFAVTLNGTKSTITNVFTLSSEKVYIGIEGVMSKDANVLVSYDGTGYFEGKLKTFTNQKATYK